MQKYFITGFMICGLLLMVSGCTSYYRVTDPSSGKAYYTTKVSDLRGGAVKIKDDKTGSTVTLQSSDVKEISENEYEAGLKAPASAKPAPAAQVPTQSVPAKSIPTEPAPVQTNPAQPGPLQ